MSPRGALRMARGVQRNGQSPHLEKFQQANIVQLARVLHWGVWVIGTRRSRGRACPTCGTFVAEGQTTRQTAGHPDLVLFPPATLLYWETKRQGVTRARDEQHDFGRHAIAAGVSFGVGDYDAFLTWCADHGYVKSINVPHYRQPHAAPSPQEIR